MKGLLEFDLNDRDECLRYYRCHKSLDMASVLFDFEINSKKNILNKIDEGNFTNDEVVDLVFERFNELMSEFNVHIEELID